MKLRGAIRGVRDFAGVHNRLIIDIGMEVKVQSRTHNFVR